ncbi:jg18404 [Pararge aegeria aegeria]|uniref:Jg18404 protein n=1 Tax=Pararge aegeria aegeria TaxID=348720 RepID=A0A8S4RA96_9NEOP|nr:jg18404 [Pararge aegeria aegeria]
MAAFQWGYESEGIESTSVSAYTLLYYNIYKEVGKSHWRLTVAEIVGSEVSSTTTLLKYLRDTLNLRGTKYMCLEGGCGACIVSAAKCPGDAPQGVNSCMVSITSCQDWDIETIEGVGNRLDGYHPLQTTLAETNGSQCGYCSPGMIMNMYSLMKTKKQTMLEIEKSLASNVCRCTGYRPIIEAFKKFASDAPDSLDLPDIEDLKICEKSGEICPGSSCDEWDWCMVSRNEVISEPLHIRLSDERDWFRVYTLSDIYVIWQAKGYQSYMLVAGNTGKGVYPILEYPKVLIDVSYVSELKSYAIDQNLVIGAGNTLTDLMSIFATVGNTDNFGYLNVLNEHLSLVAHVAVRNLGTVAGNLMLKHTYREFKSDVFLLLETVGALLTINAPDSLDLPDIEDLKICEKSGEICPGSSCDEWDWCMVSRNEVISEPLHIRLSDERDWFRVYTLSDIYVIWQAKGYQSYMLVAGNTGKGVYPILEYPKVLIDVSYVSELKSYAIDQNLVIGAGNTLTDLMSIFATVGNTDNFGYLNVLNEHLSLVAHVAVRNLGTVAGNLMLKHTYREFKSDVFLLLETVGALLTIMIAPGRRKILTMQGFLAEDMTGKIVVNVLMPPLTNDHKIVTYKGVSNSTVLGALFPAASRDSFDVMKLSSFSMLQYEVYREALKTEKYLTGKSLFRNETLQGAINVLKNELVVVESLPDPPVEYRRNVALGLFYKGLLSLIPPNMTVRPKIASGAIKLYETRPLSDGRQIFETNPTLWPLNKPIPKLEALIQCGGETTYTEDIPTLPREVFAAFTLTTVALGTIDKIDASKALKEPGVIAFYTASDIPGVNSFTPAVNLFNSTNEELLCDGQVKYFNQPYGIIVAESQSIAQRAATLVQVTYIQVKKPVIDIKKAKKDPAKATLFNSKVATRTGTEVTNVIKGENTIYWQYHFSMETLVCVSHPTEEGIRINSATQYIDSVQTMAQRVLKLNQNRLDVHVRRLGGSFGYKLSRATQVSVACSLVTYKLNRPCRFIQTLTNNMRAVGKREPSSTDFEIRVNKRGVIQYVNCELYIDNGYIANELLVMLGFDAFNNCYNMDTWNYKAYNAITDTPSNTWCRSPGSLENIAMAEVILERICYELNLDPFDVRLANLDTVNHSDLQEMAETLKTNSQYAERKAAVEKFNSINRWKKRGLRPSFLRWTPFGYQIFEVNMSVYSDDGTVAITHAGAEMGQGVNTKATQICAYFLKIPLEKVQIKPNDTFTAPNGFPSGGQFNIAKC